MSLELLRLIMRMSCNCTYKHIYLSFTAERFSEMLDVILSYKQPFYKALLSFFLFLSLSVCLPDLYLFIYLFCCLFRAAPTAYGSFQARDQIRAVAPSLHHSSQQCQILNPLTKVSDQTLVLMDNIWVPYC